MSHKKKMKFMGLHCPYKSTWPTTEGKMKSVTWHFTLEQLVFRKSKEKNKIIQSFFLFLKGDKD